MTRRDWIVELVIIAAIIGLALTLKAQAQEKPPAAPAVVEQPAASIPPIIDQDQQAFAVLNVRSQVQAEIIQALNEKLAFTNQEINQLLARLQENGKYAIQRDPQTGRLVRIPTEPKK